MRRVLSVAISLRSRPFSSSRSRPGLGLARRRAGPPAVLPRRDPYAAGQHRGIDIGARRRHAGARSGGRHRLVRRHDSGRRAGADDPDRRRLCGDAAPARLDRRAPGQRRRGRRSRRGRSARARTRSPTRRTSTSGSGSPPTRTATSIRCCCCRPRAPASAPQPVPAPATEPAPAPAVVTEPVPAAAAEAVAPRLRRPTCGRGPAAEPRAGAGRAGRTETRPRSGRRPSRVTAARRRHRAATAVRRPREPLPQRRRPLPARRPVTPRRAVSQRRKHARRRQPECRHGAASEPAHVPSRPRDAARAVDGSPTRTTRPRLASGRERTAAGAAALAPVCSGSCSSARLRRRGRARGRARAAPIIDGDELLPDDTHLLRQLDAAHRPRVHDDHGRHPRAPSPPAGRGDVLPDGGRRARRQGRARGRGAGAHAQGVRRPDRRRLAGAAERVNASIDYFIRTTDEGHKRFVQDFLQRIYDNGDVYQDVYAGLYCVGCEAFKTEDELVDGKCPDHGTEPEWLEEKNWFFRLSAYQDSCSRSTTSGPTSCCPASGRTRHGASSPAGCATSRSAARRRRGESRSRGIRIRSPTSGPMRSSTT